MGSKTDPDWTSLEPELLARIYHSHHDGDFRLTCRRWRAAADASIGKLRLTFVVPDDNFQGRGAIAADLSSLDVRFGALKELEIESLAGSFLSIQQGNPLDNLQRLAALTALRMYSTSPGGSPVEIVGCTELLIDPRLLPTAIRELGLTCSLQREPDHLTALAALTQLTQLSLSAIDMNNKDMDDHELSDHLSNHLARLSTCTELRGIKLGLKIDPEPEVLRSSVCQLTALQYLESLSIFDNPLEPAGIGQVLSLLTGLTCLRLMLDCTAFSGEAAEASLGPLRSLGKMQQLAIRADDYIPPLLHDGGRDDGFLTVLASLPGALQLCITMYDYDLLEGPDLIFSMNLGGLSRLTRLDSYFQGDEFSLDVQSLSGLRGLEPLSWTSGNHLSERDYEGLVQLGQLPLTELRFQIGGKKEFPPTFPHQLAQVAAKCNNLGRLLCLSIEQVHALSDIDLKTVGLLTSLKSLKLDQMPLIGSNSVDYFRHFRASADSTAIYHISSLTKLERLHLEAFPSVCNENVEILQAMTSLEFLVLNYVRLTVPTVNELTMLSSLRAIMVTSYAGIPLRGLNHVSTFEDQESLLTGLSVLKNLVLVQADVVKIT